MGIKANLFGSLAIPEKNDSPLLIDADRPSVFGTCQLFQAIAGRRPKVREASRIVDGTELHRRPSENLGRIALGGETVKNIFRI